MLIKNGFLLNGATNRFEQTDLLIENENIKSLCKCDTSEEIFDANGLYVIAGFVRNPWITLGASIVMLFGVLAVIMYSQKETN